MPIWTPHKYQQDAIDFALDRPNAGLFLDPGLGKTSISLYIINHFKDRTLIIAPLRVIYSVWPNEIKKWENFNNIKFTILHGPDKERNFLRNNVGVYLINPEGLKWLVGAIERHKRFPFVNLFLDESSKFKAPKSKRFKLLQRYLKLFKRRFILTGNPLPNTYLDLWAQIYILDLGQTLGNNFYRYRGRYFYQADRQGWTWKLHQGADEDIQAVVSPIVMHLAVEDVDEFDLPELVTNDIYYELPPKIMKQYKKMEKDKFVELVEEEKEKITAPSAASAVMKCAQMCNGFLYETLDEEDKIQGVEPRTFHYHDIKMELLNEVVEELQGSPIIVAYWFQEDFKRLRKAFPDAAHIGSGVSGEEGQKIERDWNAGKITIMLASMASISHGLNLQDGPGHNIFLYCHTYDFDVYDQLIRRVWRQGAKHNRVMVHRPIGRNTVEEVMVRTVEEKDKTQSAFLEAVKLYIKKL